LASTRKCYDAGVTASPWQPSRPVALLIGILSVWPFVYFCSFIAFVVFTFASVGTRGKGSVFPPIFASIFVVHVLTMLLTFLLLAIYVYHAFNTDRIANDRRVLWVLILFFGGLIAFPIYWYLYLWKTDGPPAVAGNDGGPLTPP
jgi:hypothetical protein